MRKNLCFSLILLVQLKVPTRFTLLPEKMKNLSIFTGPKGDNRHEKIEIKHISL